MISIYLPDWFLKKIGIPRTPNCLDGHIVRETDKAILLEVHPIIIAYHYKQNSQVWIPKSLIIKKVSFNQTILK